MSPTKLIHIMASSPPAGHLVDYSKRKLGIPRPLPKHFIKTDKPPYWVGFFEEDFYVVVAKKIAEKTNDYRNECWRPYIGCDKPYSREINGVLHRIFPSKPPKKSFNSVFLNMSDYSSTLISELDKEIKRGNVILHFHGFPGGHNSIILKNLDLRSTPVIVQHRGGSFKFEKYLFLKNNIRNFLLQFFYKMYTKIIEKRYLKNIDYFLMNTKAEARTVESLGFEKTLLHKDGVNFNLFKRGDKIAIRKKFGLPLDKKIMIYIGRFYKDKGVDKILKVFNSLKSKIDIHLILIGGRKEDELYEDSINSGATVITRVANKELVQYIQSADLSISLYSDYIVKFGGFGRSTLEAFACGIPFVSQNLVHFIGTENELKQLGEIPQSLKIEDLENSVLKIFNNPEKYLKCRQVAKKYYDLNVTIIQNLKIYQKCSQMYSRNY